MPEGWLHDPFALAGFCAPFVGVAAFVLARALACGVPNSSRRAQRDRSAVRRNRAAKPSRYRGRYKLSQDGKGGRSANS